MLKPSLAVRIADKKAVVGILGLGHVGLPLAVACVNAGYKVYGIDVDEQKIKTLSSGCSYISDIPSVSIRAILNAGKFIPALRASMLRGCHVIIVCVPTPLLRTKDPDMRALLQASNEIMRYVQKGTLVSIESTTYPGTTEEIFLEKLKQKKWKAGKDFYLVFSPERIDPGNKTFTVTNTPKLVGGVTKNCTKIAMSFYSQFVAQVIPVSSPKAAELTKLLENIYRSVNIAMVNELALLCEKMKLNVWEIIDAASTKPFGFTPFYPGPGLGGHCLPIDPYYLAWKAKEYDFKTRFIELSGEVNSYMPYHIVYRIRRALNIHHKSLNNARILLMGVAYKKDVNDIRESPALKIIELLAENESKIYYHDPFIPELRHAALKKTFRSVPATQKNLSGADCVVVLADHSCLDWSFIVKHSKLILDTRNTLKDYSMSKIIVL